VGGSVGNRGLRGRRSISVDCLLEGVRVDEIVGVSVGLVRLGEC